jgi:hypothetical protein
VRPICLFCNEELDGTDTAMFPVGTPEGPREAHRQCMLRSTIGGIGHLLAHQYWCNEQGDPDAGLTYRQSALMVQRWVEVVGIEETVTRSLSHP